MYCRFCGCKIDDDSLFCSHCGKKIQNDNQNTINPTNELKAPLIDAIPQSPNNVIVDIKEKTIQGNNDSDIKDNNKLEIAREDVTDKNDSNAPIITKKQSKINDEEKSKKKDKVSTYIGLGLIGAFILAVAIKSLVESIKVNSTIIIPLSLSIGGILMWYIGFILKKCLIRKGCNPQRLSDIVNGASAGTTYNTVGTVYLDTDIQPAYNQETIKCVGEKNLIKYTLAGATVQYKFFVILYHIPIIPLECHLAGGGFATGQLRFVAECKMVFSEILMFYLKRWGIITAIVGIIWLIDLLS